MTVLSRPVVAILESALATPTGSLAGDIVRLRESLTIALRRCLDEPTLEWSALVALGAERGGWDQWRVAGLLAARDREASAEGGHLDTPRELLDETRDVLAALADELIGRRDISTEPWDGSDRQHALADPLWVAGRDRRELVFAIERAMEHAARHDAAGLRSAAANVDERDPSGDAYPGLATALLACAADLDRSGSISDESRSRLRTSLGETPFAAAVDRLD